MRNLLIIALSLAMVIAGAAMVGYPAYKRHEQQRMSTYFLTEGKRQAALPSDQARLSAVGLLRQVSEPDRLAALDVLAPLMSDKDESVRAFAYMAFDTLALKNPNDLKKTDPDLAAEYAYISTHDTPVLRFEACASALGRWWLSRRGLSVITPDESL